MYRLDNIHLQPPITNERDELLRYLVRRFRLPSSGVGKVQILRRSLDARKKPHPHYVYSVAFDIKDSAAGLKLLQKERRHADGLSLYVEKPYLFPEGKVKRHAEDLRPMVIGTGPAGLFCGYYLARLGLCPIMVERGQRVEERDKSVNEFWKGGSLNLSSNVQFGEGGAGTFSDGKLYSQTSDKYGINSAVLRLFAEFGADPDILYDSHPHIGTDVLKKVVVNMREEMVRMGAEFLFLTCFQRPVIQDGCFLGAELLCGEKLYERSASCLILCTGHSARDTFVSLHRSGIAMESKAFAVGFRVQHLQENINSVQYGEYWRELKLPPADYRLTANGPSGRGVYSFCMCPGGYVVNASSEEGRLAVNGMSYRGRASRNANSAIVATVDQRDFGTGLFDGMHFQQKLEEAAFRAGNGAIPIQTLGDFRNGRTEALQSGIEPQIKGKYCYSSLRGIMPPGLEQDISDSFEDFGRKIRGFDDPDALLAGVESRTSSPLRILRNESGQSNIDGIFPCGEGAGYAGGITSAAADGIRTAENVVKYIQNKAGILL